MADESKSKSFAAFYEAFGVSDDEDDIFVGFLCEDLGLRPYRGLNGEDKAKRDLIETKSRFGRHLVQRVSIDKAKRTRKRSEHKSKSSDGRKNDESKRQSGSKETIVRQHGDEEKRQEEEERFSEIVNVVKTDDEGIDESRCTESSTESQAIVDEIEDDEKAVVDSVKEMDEEEKKKEKEETVIKPMEKESTPEVQAVDEENTEGMATDDIRNSEEKQSLVGSVERDSQRQSSPVAQLKATMNRGVLKVKKVELQEEEEEEQKKKKIKKSKFRYLSKSANCLGLQKQRRTRAGREVKTPSRLADDLDSSPDERPKLSSPPDSGDDYFDEYAYLKKAASVRKRRRQLFHSAESAELQPKKRFRTSRCQHCEGCQVAKDCGTCINCRDKPKFGGRNLRRQCCVLRKCRNQPSYKLFNNDVVSETHVPRRKVVPPPPPPPPPPSFESPQSRPARRAALNPRFRIVAVEQDDDDDDDDGGDERRTFRRKTRSTTAVKYDVELKDESSLSLKRYERALKDDGGGERKSFNSVLQSLASDRPQDDANSFRKPKKLLGYGEANLKLSLKSVIRESDAWLQGFCVPFLTPLSYTGPLCFLCGSGGIQELVFCTACSEPFHSFCAGFAPMKKNRWYCANCIVCEVCGLSDDLFECAQCHSHFHSGCLSSDHPVGLPQDDLWRCSTCVKCTGCGAISSGDDKGNVWSEDLTLCGDCTSLKKKKNICPICSRCYRDNDFETMMVQCTTCERWIHSECERITDDEYNALSLLQDSIAEFECSKCSTSQIPKWKEAIDDDFKISLKKIAVVLRDQVSSLSSNGSPVGHLLSLLNEAEDAVYSSRPTLFGGKILDCLSNFRCHFVNDSQRREEINSVEAKFCEHFLKLFPWFSSESALEECKKLQQKTTSSRNDETVSRSLVSTPFPSSDHDYDAESESLESRQQVCLSNIRDVRSCVFCGLIGDKDPDDAGRLICISLDEWAHINCALWSAEVYERSDGRLHHLDRALLRGRQLKCHHCHRTGATIGCCDARCHLTFHFTCAKTRQCVFLANQRVFCKAHAEKIKNKSPVMATLRTNRRVYVDLTKMRPSRSKLESLSHSTLNFKIGNLLIYNFGSIHKESETKDRLYPIGYSARRYFWSTKNVSKFCWYECSISLDDRASGIVSSPTLSTNPKPPSQLKPVRSDEPRHFQQESLSAKKPRVHEPQETSSTSSTKNTRVILKEPQRISQTSATKKPRLAAAPSSTGPRPKKSKVSAPSPPVGMATPSPPPPLIHYQIIPISAPDVQRVVDMMTNKKTESTSNDVSAIRMDHSYLVPSNLTLGPLLYQSGMRLLKQLTPILPKPSDASASASASASIAVELSPEKSSPLKGPRILQRKSPDSLKTSSPLVTPTLPILQKSIRPFVMPVSPPTTTGKRKSQVVRFKGGDGASDAPKKSTTTARTPSAKPSLSKVKGSLNLVAGTNSVIESCVTSGSPAKRRHLTGNRRSTKRQLRVSRRDAPLPVAAAAAAAPAPAPEAPSPLLRFVIKSEDGFEIEASSCQAAWKKVVDTLVERRQESGMFYTAFANIDGLVMFGLTHDYVLGSIEQLSGSKDCTVYAFKQFSPHPLQAFLPKREHVVKVNLSGCARSEKDTKRVDEHDMFSFLNSKHRIPPQLKDFTAESGDNDIFLRRQHQSNVDLPMSMRYRAMQKACKKSVAVFRSSIHGRGLYSIRDIQSGEMVIEYTGTVIRSVLTDKREDYYESKGIGCYMFRIDSDEVVDATLSGNAARFINHSCEPNCYSKILTIDGTKKIVIFASRGISQGEELTYDYKFPIEDVKIPCNCGAENCRRFLN